MRFQSSRRIPASWNPPTGHTRGGGRAWRPEGFGKNLFSFLGSALLEDEDEATPFSRAQRSLVYQRAKGDPDKRPFGTQLDVAHEGYEPAFGARPLKRAIQRQVLDQFAGRQYAFGRLLYYNRTIRLPDLLGSGVFIATVSPGKRVGDPVRVTTSLVASPLVVERKK